MYSECPDYDDSQSMADLYSEDGTYSGPKIGKKLALKKYDQFALNTGCFWGSTGSNNTLVVKFHVILMLEK